MYAVPYELLSLKDPPIYASSSSCHIVVPACTHIQQSTHIYINTDKPVRVAEQSFVGQNGRDLGVVLSSGLKYIDFS